MLSSSTPQGDDREAASLALGEDRETACCLDIEKVHYSKDREAAPQGEDRESCFL